MTPQMHVSRHGRRAHNLRRAGIAFASGLATLAASLTAATSLASPAGAIPTTCTIAAAGDVAGDDMATGAARTASLVQKESPAKVLALGDLAYNNGAATDFASYFEPTWGAFKSLIAPTPGNHEYNTDGASGYYQYFAAAPNYSFDVCGWHVISVDQYKNRAAAIAFIAADAAANAGKPLIVFWHEPRFSSGSEHGSESSMQDLWNAANKAGAKIVLNGHDHDYERFAEMDANGTAKSGGTREFVSGNGGHHLRSLGTLRPNSERQITGKPGVLFLTLQPASYDWRYIDVDGVVGDSGTQTIALRQPAAVAPTTSEPAVAPPATTTTSTSTTVPSPPVPVQSGSIMHVGEKKVKSDAPLLPTALAGPSVVQAAMLHLG